MHAYSVELLEGITANTHFTPSQCYTLSATPFVCNMYPRDVFVAVPTSSFQVPVKYKIKKLYIEWLHHKAELCRAFWLGSDWLIDWTFCLVPCFGYIAAGLHLSDHSFCILGPELRCSSNFEPSPVLLNFNVQTGAGQETPHRQIRLNESIFYCIAL